MIYCLKCVLPDTKPDLALGDDGVCSACHSYDSRTKIDWESRERDFIELVKSLGSNPSAYDCLVPVSGGKDSTYQVLKLKELGLNPLAVTATTCALSPIGARNIENLKRQGVDHFAVSPNPNVRAMLNKAGLEIVGDISWPEHVGIFTIPIRVAVWLGIPLIVWGENSQNEYGGPEEAAKRANLDRKWLEEFGGLLGLRVSDIPSVAGVTEKDMFLYSYPSDNEIEKLGLKGLFLGQFFPWDGLSNALVAQANGFETLGQRVEGSIVDYENLDNYQTGIHDYFKFLKFGFGRASDLASLHVRRGRFSRNTAIELVKQFDGKFPWTYLGNPIEEILRPIGIGLDQFMSICDQFTNRALFETNSDGSLARDSSHSLIKLKYDNE